MYFSNVQKHSYPCCSCLQKLSFEDLGSGENSKGRHPQDKITTGIVKTLKEAP